ncbi:MAG: hypothetical protein MK207_10630 [Saprospiraceae bacterium]|nr:hypothetical protein [Saprospiraceae bacterium]
MKHYTIIILFFILILQGCDIPSIDQTKISNKDFFDLKLFFNNEAEYLKSKNIRIKKIIKHNNTIEENIQQIDDWENELKIFSDCDINKPSCKNRYTVDSTLSNSGFMTLHYEANDEKMQTKVIDIQISENNVHSIMIINKETNNIFESQQYLTYIPGKRYTIDKIQSVTLFEKENYSIDVQFIE